MSNEVLSFTRVFAIQLRLVLARGWRARAIGFGLVLVQLVAMVFFGVLLGINISSDGVSFTQVADFADAVDIPLNRVTGALLVCLVGLLIVGWFGPFKLWEGEAPRMREYHWAMPVAKGRHDLARVSAGLVVLMGWAAALYGTVLVLAAASGSLAQLAAASPMVWLCLFLGPTLWYGVTTFFTVRLEHPTGWLWAIIGSLAALSTLSAILPLGPVVRVLEILFSERWGLFAAVGGPVATTFLGFEYAKPQLWPVAWLGWAILLSLAIVWAAYDRRRLP